MQKTYKELSKITDELLSSLPPEVYDLIQIVRVNTQAFEQYMVVIPLWTKEEQQSDLSLEFSVKVIDNQMLVKLLDIHVL